MTDGNKKASALLLEKETIFVQKKIVLVNTTNVAGEETWNMELEGDFDAMELYSILLQLGNSIFFNPEIVEEYKKTEN